MAPVGLRVKGTVATRVAASHRPGGEVTTSTVAGASPRSLPAGPGPPVTVRRTRPTGAPASPRPGDGGGARRAQLVVGQRHHQVEGVGRAVQAAEVAGEGEGDVVDHLQGLEDPVARR